MKQMSIWIANLVLVSPLWLTSCDPSEHLCRSSPPPHHVHHLLLLCTRVKDGEMKKTLRAHRHTQVSHRWRKCPVALWRLNKRRRRRHLIPSIAFLLLMVWGASTHCLTHAHTHTTSAAITPPGCVSTARWWNCAWKQTFVSKFTKVI